MLEGLVSLLVFLLLTFGFFFAYKKRYAISRWLEDPDIASNQDPKTQRMNLEHKIAVAQRKLEIMEGIQAKKDGD